MSARTITIAASVAAIALAGCGSEDSGDGTTAADPGRIGQSMESITPAVIDEHPQGFVSSDIIRPLENAWRAGSHTSFTEVDAGALQADKKTGAFAIFRHDFLDAKQTSKLVEVKGSGPVRITKAPTGDDVVESAQETGKIEFSGRGGVRGTLDLNDDSVRLDGS
jgi:hypothetical protein